MMEALRLAKFTEDKIQAQQRSKSSFVPFRNMGSQRPPIPLASRSPPIKHLSKTEMQARREKGLCYNCDEKFNRVHRCVQQNLYLLDVDSPPASKIGEEVADVMDARLTLRSRLLTLHLRKTSLRYPSML